MKMLTPVTNLRYESFTNAVKEQYLGKNWTLMARDKLQHKQNVESNDIATTASKRSSNEYIFGTDGTF